MPAMFAGLCKSTTVNHILAMLTPKAAKLQPSTKVVYTTQVVAQGGRTL